MDTRSDFPSNSPVRRLACAALAVAMLLLVAMMPAQSAAAHDQVIRQFPTAGQALDAAPTEVSLTFTADPLDVGATVMVVDAFGENWAPEDPIFDGSTLTQTVIGALPDGNYQVRWRIVSNDGHPISESFLFSVGDAENAPPVPAPSSAGEPTEEIDGQAQGDFAIDGALGSSDDLQSGIPRPLFAALIGGAVALVVFAIGRALIIRSRKHRASTAGIADASEGNTK